MKTRISISIVVILMLLVSSGAWADSISYLSVPVSLGPTSTAWGPTNIAVPQWNAASFAAGAVLQKITLTYDGTVLGTIQYENTSTGAPNNTVTGNLAASMSLWDPGSTLLLTCVPTVTQWDSLPTYDGTTDYAGDSGKTYNNQTATQQSIWWDTTSPYITMFSGTGSVTMTTGATGASTASDTVGYFSSAFTTQAGAALQVTYDYDYSDIPEPTTLALSSLALLGLGFARRRRNKK